MWYLFSLFLLDSWSGNKIHIIKFLTLLVSLLLPLLINLDLAASIKMNSPWWWQEKKKQKNEVMPFCLFSLTTLVSGKVWFYIKGWTHRISVAQKVFWAIFLFLRVLLEMTNSLYCYSYCYSFTILSSFWLFCEIGKYIHTHITFEYTYLLRRNLRPFFIW